MSLRTKLFLVTLVPIGFLFFVFAIYLFIPDKLTETWSLSAIMVYMAVCIIVSFVFIRRLATRVVRSGKAIADLSAGKSFETLKPVANDELSIIELSINKLGDEISGKTRFADQIRVGNLDVPFTVSSGTDLLGQSLLQLRDNLAGLKDEDRKRNWTSDGLSRFVEILRSDKSLNDLASDIVTNLVRTLNANQGAIFIVNDSGEEAFLEMKSCYAYDKAKHFTQRIEFGEGVVGQAFLEKATVHLKKVPADFVRITSGLGASLPRNILITPLKVGDNVVGIFELASFNEFAAHEISFVERIGENIAHTITSFQINENTKRLLAESQELTEQMKMKEEALKQNQEEMQATQEEISRKYDELFARLTELNYQSKFDQLRSITSTKRRNVEYYFDIIRSQIITLAENKMIVEFMKELKEPFHRIHKSYNSQDISFFREGLRKYYSEEFVPRIIEDEDVATATAQYIPEDEISIVLQYLYIAKNAHPTGKKLLLDDAGDGSDYTKLHAEYHPVMRRFLDKFGYYDIFLVDEATGHIVYSVFKEVDFATSLLSGKYSKTNFGKVVRDAAANLGKGEARLVDFELYGPSYDAPASFIASPVYDEGKKTGILVFQMPIHKINQVLTGDNKWKEDGLGDSGETILVGDDTLLRSISRGLIENKTAYLDALKKIGYNPASIQKIDKTGTNILLKEVFMQSVSYALQGRQGTEFEESGLGERVLTAYAPLNIPDVRWVILSMLKESEASAWINELRGKNV